MRIYAQSLTAAFTLSIVIVAGAFACSSPDGTPQSHPTGAGGSGNGGSGNGGSGNGGSGNGGSGNGGSANGGTAGNGGMGGQGGSSTVMNETWMDGKQITANVTIAAGGTVTIAPGATITITNGAIITVDGTLKAANNTTHAKLTGTWGGLVVEGSGNVDLDSVDFNGATTNFTVNGGTAKLANGTMTGGAPFQVAKGASLTFDHVNEVKATGSSNCNGSFTASYFDYDANGHGDAITTEDPAAVLSISDSKLHGSIGDFVVTSGATSVMLTHTEITGTHCAFHFNALTKFDLSYLNIHGNSYGWMAYGSTSGGQITYSNVENNGAYGFDEGGTAGKNGLITIDHCYFATNGTDIQKEPDNSVTVTNPSATAVTGVGPR